MCYQLANIIIQTSTQHFLTKKILNKLCNRKRNRLKPRLIFAYPVQFMK